MSLFDDFVELEQQMLSMLGKMRRYVARLQVVEHAIHGVPQEPESVVQHPPSSSATGSLPKGEPTLRVKSTMWRNKADECVDPSLMNNGVLAMPGDGWRHSWVALPAQVVSGVGRRVWARLSSTPSCPPVGPAPQADTGPWWDGTRGTRGSYSPDLEDHWWDGAPTRRPRVESAERDARGRVDNGAGIDITPRFGAEIVKAAGQHSDLTVEQLAMRYYEAPCELMLDVWVEESPEDHDGPSPHFTWAEVSCSTSAQEKGIDNTVSASVRPGVIEFALGIVEPLREALGRPMKYGVDWMSWYRSTSLNALVGGAAASDHLTGRGIDVPRTEEFWRALRAAKVSLPLKVNVEPDHYDVKVGEVDGTVTVNWINGATKSAWEV